MFPSPFILCEMFMYFEVSRQKEWWEYHILNKNHLIKNKMFLGSLEVVFDLWEKGLMRTMGDENTFAT